MTGVQLRPALVDPTAANDLVAAAAAIVPKLRDGADQADHDRRLPEPSVTALRDGGFYRLTTPRRFGGHQLSMRTYLETTAELARGCSSAAWVTMVLGGGSFSTALFSERAQLDVWAENPDTAIAGVLSPGGTGVPAQGGQRLTGKWAFASACYQADWIVLVFNIVDDEGQPCDQGLALVPLSDLTIEDTWFVAGMRGTGSNTVVADDIFVPDHRIQSMTAIAQGHYATEFTDEVEYRTHAVTALYLGIVGPQLGMAQAAMDRALEIVSKGKPIAYSFYQRSSDSPSYQLNLADAASLIDRARMVALRAADDLDQAGRTGNLPDTLVRARIRMDIGQAAKLSREAVDLLLNVGGAGSFAEVNSLQRIWRDIETASRHASINTDLAREIYGKALLGIEDQVAPF